MWRWPGQLPPLPLPPPSARGRPRGRGDKAGGAPRSPPPTSPLARLLAHSSLASLAPALGRYSSPIVPRKQNGGVGGEDPVRAHPSPLRGPSSRGSASRGGCARTGPPAAASPRQGFVCCGVPRARAHVLDAHTPLRLGASRPARQERPPPLTRSSLSHSGAGVQEGPRFWRRETGPPLSLHGAGSWTPVPTLITEEAFVDASLS